MAPNRTSTSTKKGSSFNAPRAKNNTSKPTTPSTTKARKADASKARSHPLTSTSPTHTDSPLDTSPTSPDFMLAELVPDSPVANARRATLEEDDDAAKLPEKLVLTLLNQSFQNKEKTKLGKDAVQIATKYVEVFLREAIARAAFEKTQREEDGGMTDGFLEVEDLEKMAPQLVLDF